MKKFLSIIIPKYKETEKEIFPLLSSINNQAGIDFSDIEVIISNDGGGNGLLNEGFLSLFDMDIRQISLTENRGPGVARQAGLDIACGQYVMFCDADDIIHNSGVLGALIQEAELNSPDMISTSWLEEIKDNNMQYHYITHENENTWMHGKLIRRNFLVQNNIRFHDELRVHEDSYFLCIAASLTNNRRHLPITSYIWKHNPNSITRRNDSIYTFNSMTKFIEACSMAHKQIEKLVSKELMEYKILQFVLYNYFTYHLPMWKAKENEKFLKESESTFVKCVLPMWHYWTDANLQTISTVYNEERKRTFGNNIEFETVWEWIERLGINNNRE